MYTLLKKTYLSEAAFALLILLSAIALRASFLEYSDLVDPTEARYASVAQEMVLSGNWITPHLPMPEGVIPYLGKPPLHFWLTSIAYSIFGTDEWTARLPSLLCSILIIGVVGSFALTFFTREIALLTTLICFSSVLFYFLAGASVTDVTLTACISLAILFLYRFVSMPTASSYSIYAAALFSALAFLCKGPVGIVLIAFPFGLWSIFTKDFSWMKRIPWIRSILLFLAVTSPWFILSEIENPGFLKYFFWNENLARYLLKNYGDKYGSGHAHFYGMSWLMFFIAFMPWTPLLIWSLVIRRTNNIQPALKTNSHTLFCLAWMISTPLFFTFVHQLHAMYVLPSIPGAALFCAIVLQSAIDKSVFITKAIRSNITAFVLISFWILVAIVSIFLEHIFVMFALGTFILIVGGFFIYYARRSITTTGIVSFISGTSLVSYMVVLAVLTPYIDCRRSTEIILKEIANAEHTPPAEPSHFHKIGILTRNAYSHYWASKAWESELSAKVTVQYVALEDIKNSDVCFFLVKAKSLEKVPAEVKDNIKFEKQFDDWFLFKKQ